MDTDKKFNTVIVFDLDDTLYKEREYQRSGFLAVIEWAQSVYGKLNEKTLQRLCASSDANADFLSEVCNVLKLPLTVKDSLLWVYRLHDPKISLGDEVKELLRHINARFHVGILTDGRSASQRLKVKALGLDDYPLYISEEYGEEKPSMLRFKKVMNDFPGMNYVYVGDNPAKDFIAPNCLGWKTIGVRDDGSNIHPQDVLCATPQMQPDLWIDKITLLPHELC